MDELLMWLIIVLISILIVGISFTVINLLGSSTQKGVQKKNLHNRVSNLHKSVLQDQDKKDKKEWVREYMDLLVEYHDSEQQIPSNQRKKTNDLLDDLFELLQNQ